MLTFKFLPCFSLFFLFTSLISLGIALPLSTDSRWIVDENGHRVKLACVNWGSHLQPMTAEGLDKQPLDFISKKIASMGFNCVRFTWPTYLMTNQSLANLTVRQSFQSFGDKLNQSLSGIAAKNPNIIDLPLVEAFKAVIGNLQDNNVMVILDNHLTVPGWCCGWTDGNGFFGDEYFPPDLWVEGLSRMATLSKDFSNVVGMSLRNELRGPKQNEAVWYREMPRGAETIHAINPNILVIFSGFNYDKSLAFLNKKWLNLSFTGKLVFEVHHYGFTDGQQWVNNNPNKICAEAINEMKRDTLFLLDKGYPLIMSEFGVDQRGNNVNDNRYINCYLATLAELDMDWCLWTLYGSYYYREGAVGLEEFYGLLTWNWGGIRNESYLKRIQAIQLPFRGPGLSESNNTYKVIFHPLTGLCVKSSNKYLKLSPCKETDKWSFVSGKIFSNKKCIQATDEGKPAKLGRSCGVEDESNWETISDSKMQLSTNIITRNTTVCMDIDSNNTIVTNRCKCFSEESSCDPESQWFKFVDANRALN
ncbi:hypothetical protein ACFE04_022636 [Oxalis oulophora]